ncbi:hypothetical protein C8J56DRAFT_1080118 [Mycena floridula]|nr:hypothetical protein C8J56DRAFT_1080118 [Mycena floridula]
MTKVPSAPQTGSGWKYNFGKLPAQPCKGPEARKALTSLSLEFGSLARVPRPCNVLQGLYYLPRLLGGYLVPRQEVVDFVCTTVSPGEYDPSNKLISGQCLAEFNAWLHDEHLKDLPSLIFHFDPNGTTPDEIQAIFMCTVWGNKPKGHLYVEEERATDDAFDSETLKFVTIPAESPPY